MGLKHGLQAYGSRRVSWLFYVRFDGQVAELLSEIVRFPQRTFYGSSARPPPLAGRCAWPPSLAACCPPVAVNDSHLSKACLW